MGKKVESNFLASLVEILNCSKFHRGKFFENLTQGEIMDAMDTMDADEELKIKELWNQLTPYANVIMRNVPQEVYWKYVELLPSSYRKLTKDESDKIFSIATESGVREDIVKDFSMILGKITE